MLVKDSDLDGISDWEEALWGTDINNKNTFEGKNDADYIKEKKLALKIENGDTGELNSGNLTETDKFAQQFFASLSAMQQNGQVDQNTINNVSTALGQKIVDPTIIDQYSEKDVKISGNDGIDAQKTYYTTIKKLFETYSKKGIGDEIEITAILASVNTMTVEEKSEYIKKLTEISNAYQEYATKVIGTLVPINLSSNHLKIANSAHNTGISVNNMAEVINDPIVGLSGLSQYQKYSDELILNVENLETILYNNGAIIDKN
jgi:hypothetical protein